MSLRRRPGPGFHPNCSAKLPPLHNVIYAEDRGRQGDTTRVYYNQNTFRRVENIPVEKKNLVPMSCNQFYNLTRLLALAIRSNDYFIVLDQIEDFNYIIDQIAKYVKYLFPIAIGTKVRKPSKAFILLYKLFTIKLTTPQLKTLITHGASPYIRAIGFLYLRFVVHPSLLIKWFYPYIEDMQEFYPGGYQEERETIGQFITKLMTESEFYELELRELPLSITNEFKEIVERKKYEKVRRNRVRERRRRSRSKSQSCDKSNKHRSRSRSHGRSNRERRRSSSKEVEEIYSQHAKLESHHSSQDHENEYNFEGSLSSSSDKKKLEELTLHNTPVIVIDDDDETDQALTHNPSVKTRDTQGSLSRLRSVFRFFSTR